MSQVTQQIESKVFTTIPSDLSAAERSTILSDPTSNSPPPTPATHHEQHYFRDRRQSWLERMTDAAGGHRLLGCAAAGTFITGLWLATFTVGLSIPSQPFRDRLLTMGSTVPDQVNGAAGIGFPEAVSDVAMVAISFTPTNLALLCCVSALAGCLGRMASTNGVVERCRSEAVQVSTVSSSSTPSTSTTPAQTASISTSERSITSSDADKVSPLAPAISAVTWGFFIYLVALSGTLIISGEPFKNASPEQYVRMASSASLAAFVVGWKPDILNQLLDKMRGSPMFGSAPAK